MAEWTEVQKAFDGGEISGRLYMRDDYPAHSRSLAVMRNFIPSLQGTAVRTPGTRFFMTAGAADCRLIPFLSQSNEECLVIIRPASAEGANDGEMEVISSATGLVENGTALVDGQMVRAPSPVWINIAENPSFAEGLKYWWASPIEYTGGNSDLLGCKLVNNAVLMKSRAWKFPTEEDASAFLAKTLTIPEDTTSISFTPSYVYQQNFSTPEGKYTAELNFGTIPFGKDIYTRSFNEKTFPVGTSYRQPVTLTEMANGDPIAFTAGQKIYMIFTFTAIEDPDIGPSTPTFTFFSMIVQSLVLREITSEVVGSLPYTIDEIPDIQYVQSPYTTVGSGGKEMIFVHPNYPPKWLRFVGTYAVEDVPFFYELDGAQEPWIPPEWGTPENPGYPAACTSFNGRLIMAGSVTSPILGSSTGTGTETVWGTMVGNWTQFTDPAATEVNPDDSIELTSIYRSPIQWVAGQKELLVGARGMEYVVSADGIFQPADLGVSMHSTHGSVNVQPVAIGETILFAAEGGTKVRAMNFRSDTEGYVAPDMSFMHPYLFQSKIVRAFRMRSPHQIAGFVMGNGQIALLSYDPNFNVVAWSRVDLGAVVRDACVLQDTNGTDVLFVTVERVIQGVRVLYIEAFKDWTDWTWGEYLMSASRYVVNNASVITGLDHLEGQRVQVVGDNNFLGSYIVEAGQISLLDQLGIPIKVASALVGLPMSAEIVTLPLVTADPGSKKRYVDIQVRGVFTTKTMINGERAADRTPSTLMNASEPVAFLGDWKVANMGSDIYQVIRIEENVPFRSEVIGIFGKVKASSL